MVETPLDFESKPQTAPLLSLLNGPYVTCEGRVLQIPEGSQRLVVYVALSRRTVDRRQVACTLWPDVDDERSAGNLRSALWRLKRRNIDVVSADKQRLWLSPGTQVDLYRLMGWSSRILQGCAQSSDLGLPFAETGSIELLP